MGPWWFAQFDPVSEVSQAAKRSLQVCYVVFILQLYFNLFLLIIENEKVSFNLVALFTPMYVL